MNNSVMSSIVGKGGSESALTKALDNANEVGKSLDLKSAKKSK